MPLGSRVLQSMSLPILQTGQSYNTKLFPFSITNPCFFISLHQCVQANRPHIGVRQHIHPSLSLPYVYNHGTIMKIKILTLARYHNLASVYLNFANFPPQCSFFCLSKNQSRILHLVATSRQSPPVCSQSLSFMTLTFLKSTYWSVVLQNIPQVGFV